MLKRLKAGLKSTLQLWDLPHSAKVTLLNVSENATFRIDDTEIARRMSAVEGGADVRVRVNILKQGARTNRDALPLAESPGSRTLTGVYN